MEDNWNENGFNDQSSNSTVSNSNYDMQSGSYTDVNNNYNYQNNNYGVPENQKKGLGIAAIILGGLSILCCCCVGLGFLMAVIGGIFSIICLVKGTGSGRTLGIVGIILNGIGLLLGLYVIISLGMMINWENFTMENLNEIQYIDPDNDEELLEWMQQFFRMDIRGYYYQ